MSGPRVVDAVALDLRGLSIPQRRGLSHAMVRGQVVAAADFAAYPPSRGSFNTVRADLAAIQLALDADVTMADVGPWAEDVPEGWRELTRLLEALERLADAEREPNGPLVDRLRLELVDATDWKRWRPPARRGVRTHNPAAA